MQSNAIACVLVSGLGKPPVLIVYELGCVLGELIVSQYCATLNRENIKPVSLSFNKFIRSNPVGVLIGSQSSATLNTITNGCRVLQGESRNTEQ
jgi:hypothetical protein